MAWSWLRIAAAVVGLSAVVAGFIVNVDRATRESQSVAAVLANYFSLFTIISTILAAAALVTAAVWSRRNPGTSAEPLGIAIAVAGTTGPILLLGVVYNVLLRGIPGPPGDPAPIAFLDTYAVEVLHVVMPIYFLIDLLFAPRRRGLPWWSLGVLVAYPLVWAVYTMVRGELTPHPDGSTAWWYPYPFLDPHGDGGYASALMYVGAILIGFLVISSIVIAVGRFREKRAAARAEAASTVSAPV
jgi:hypothetical protein